MLTFFASMVGESPLFKNKKKINKKSLPKNFRDILRDKMNAIWPFLYLYLNVPGGFLWAIRDRKLIDSVVALYTPVSRPAFD